MKWPRWSCVKASRKSSSLLISFTIVVVFVFLAALPAFLDEYLLSNNDFCYPAIKKLSPRQNRYLHDDGINVHRQWSITNMILRRLASHLWLNDIDDAIIATSTNEACENNYADRNDNDLYSSSHLLHPLCAQYRKLRSQLHFRKLYIPWNWYYRKQSSSLHIRVIGISLRSSTSLLLSSSCATRDNCYTENENDTTSQSSWEWGIGWIVIHGTRVNDDALVVTTPPPLPIDDLSNLYQLLPPSFEIKSTNFSIRYPWTRPIISVQMSGITINIIVRRTTSFTRVGEFLPPRSMNNKKVFNEESSSLSFLIGDMTMREALLLLPRPPNVEGLYPRIGIVNVTNVTLCVYEIRSSSSSSSSSVDDVDYGSGSGSDLSLELLLKFSVPDNVFVPVTNMTLAHEPDGIDMKHFQPLMVESIIHALQQHLLQETTIAFRNSWDTANRAHAQVQQLVLQTQHLYLERWISMGVQAWKKGVVDGKLAPMIRAVEDWLGDIRDIAAEPITPLTAIMSRHWNTTLVGILKHSISIDEQLWSYVQKFSDRVMSFKKDTASSNQLHVFGEAIDKFIVKSSKDIELLMKSCEMEVKDMWLDWHRRFHLDVKSLDD